MKISDPWKSIMDGYKIPCKAVVGNGGDRV